MKFNEKKLKKELSKILSLIKPGLEEGKCLFNDGLMNIELEDLRKISDELLVLLVIIIQAYPGNTAEFDDEKEELVFFCNMLNQLKSFAQLQKCGYGKFSYGHNKLDKNINMEILELSMLSKEIK